jgi:hypothetical protein
MKKLYILGGLAGLLALSSCTDHVVIPPPVPLVDLNCKCDMMMDDTNYVYDDTCQYYSNKNIVTEGVSTARYTTTLEDDILPGTIWVEVRSISWSDDGSNNPTLSEWKAFLEDNPTPGFSDNVDHNGIEVRWLDEYGELWVSDTAQGPCIESFVFNTLIQESDTLGDWMQFDATLDCRMVRESDGTEACLTNGHIRSAFKLE